MNELPLTILIPVYNEAENILATLRGLNVVATEHEVLLIYDFDEDSTLTVLRAHRAEFPAVRPVRNTNGRGVLNAMKAGINAARGTYVVIMMADGSDDPRDISQMVRIASVGADIVSASRYMPGGRQIGGPRLKRLMSRMAGLSLHLIGMPTHDPTNNFKLYRRTYLNETSIESVAGFELALELTAKAAAAHRVIRELPTTWRDRSAGSSRFRLRAWLPHYLKWYMFFLRWKISRIARAPVRRSKA
jgi:dolichol-phosphate mannosyltransferase